MATAVTLEERVMDDVQLDAIHSAVPNQRRTSAITGQSDAHSSTAITPESREVLDSGIPDGGYGFVIVIACAILTFWFVGTTYSWGVIQGALVSEGISQASTLSFVGALTVACISFFAIINARIVTLIGAQRTGLLGVALLGLGEILGSFCTQSVGGLFATIGLVMGCGASLCFMTVSTVPGQYFLRRRGLANGIVYAGGGFGGAAICLITERLLEKLGPAWTFRLIGLITLVTGLPAAYLIRERVPVPRKNLVEWSLFKSLNFNLLFVAGMTATFPLFVPPFFLPLYCRSIGLGPSTGAAMVATFNFASALGRIGLGLSCDRVGPLNTLSIILFLGGLSMLVLWPISQSLAPLVIFVIINGAANGGFFSVMPTLVGSVYGGPQLAVAMSMVVTGWAGGYLMGGPIAGYLLEAFGGADQGISAYRPAMYYAGSMSMGAALMIALMRMRIDRKIIKKV